MMFWQQFLPLLAIQIFFIINCSGECENGCSGHGKCTVYDMCVCYRNWQGNDCGDRICLFGSAFADTPLGDLDSSGDVDGPDVVTIVNSPDYPYGTTEQFPSMIDTDNHIVTQSAHSYTECSSAGVCNRQTGECECYEGFEGVACHRMACPGISKPCSGHGTCHDMKLLGDFQSGTSYKLWSKLMLRGCHCDKGFYGSDCSQRYCPVGFDPLYFDDYNNIQYPYFFLAIMTTSHRYDLSNGLPQGDPGHFRLKVFDSWGQGFLTNPIEAPASCASLITALENIPNKVIPVGYTKCFHAFYNRTNPLAEPEMSISYNSLYQNYFSGVKTYELQNWVAPLSAGYISSYAANSSTDPLLTGDLYLLQFFGNPGYFQQPEVSIYDYIEGPYKVPTLTSPGGNLITKVWTNGQQGTGIDYFPYYCPEVKVSIISSEGETFLWGQEFTADNLLACLGGADFNPDNDQISESAHLTPYDTGTLSNPHLVKLTRVVTEKQDGGFLAVIFYDISGSDFVGGSGYRISGNNGSAFRVLHPLYSPDMLTNALFSVFTTRGVLKMVQHRASAHFDFGTNRIYTTNSSVQQTPLFGKEDYADITCERFGDVKTGTNTSTWDCLDKNDLFMIIDPYHTFSNPPFMNLYQAMSIQRVLPSDVIAFGDAFKNTTANKNHSLLITTDLFTNWASAATASGTFHIYKFIPDSQDSYNYHTECSGRGLCNTFEGVCECFGGYEGEACQTQHTIPT